MTELNQKILKLLEENKSMEEISSKLGISLKQLYVRIKQIINYGYNIEPVYYYNSDIRYKFKKDNFNIDKNRVNIKITESDDKFRCLVISDLHIGSIDSDITLMNYVYEYAKKNNINIILNCGDIIEGDYTSTPTNIHNIHSQIEYLIKKYPYDKEINNFMIFGNHDQHSLRHDSLDISKTISKARYDLIPIGSGQGNVNIRNDQIILFHKLYEGFKPDIKNGDKIVLAGHSHMMKAKLRDIFWLGIPTLSYKSNDKTKDVIPGFVDLTIDMEKDKFEYVEAKHLIITPKVVQVSEVRGKVKTLFNDKRK